MFKKKISVSIAQKLVKMINGEQISSSLLPKPIAAELLEEELLGIITHGSRTSYYLLDRDACRVYIETNYCNGNSIEKWIELMSQSEDSLKRSTLVKEMGDSKLVSIRTFRGFLVNCCEPIWIKMDEKPFLLSPIEGMAIFIQNPDSFIIPPDVVIVGIENGENFSAIRRQRYLFSDKKILFVSRYPQSSDLRNWLINIPNQYLHFGDFDLAGIHIYLTEFYKYLGVRSSFFIPKDIESRIKSGNSNLYDWQYAKYSNMEVTDIRLLPFVKMIHKYRRVYEQEGYIE